MYIYVNPRAELQVLRLLVATIATTLFTTALEWLLYPLQRQPYRGAFLMRNTHPSKITTGP